MYQTFPASLTVLPIRPDGKQHLISLLQGYHYREVPHHSNPHFHTFHVQEDPNLKTVPWQWQDEAVMLHGNIPCPRHISPCPCCAVESCLESWKPLRLCLQTWASQENPNPHNSGLSSSTVKAALAIGGFLMLKVRRGHWAEPAAWRAQFFLNESSDFAIYEIHDAFSHTNTSKSLVTWSPFAQFSNSIAQRHI